MITVNRFSSKHSMLARLVAQPPSPCRPLEVTAMQGQVAVAAQRDQVLLRIIPGLTAKFLVMDLEVLQAPAGLTSPSIPLQDFSTKVLVQFRIQSQAWLLRSNPTHDTV
jgi:hypothetical protein